MTPARVVAGKNIKNAMDTKMSTRKSKPIPDDKEQFARFIEAAGRIEEPDARKAFEEAIGKIAKNKRISKINISEKIEKNR